MMHAKRQISLGDRRWEIELELGEDRLELWIDGVRQEFEIRRGPGSRFELLDSAVPHALVVRAHGVRDGDRLWVHAGETRCFTVERSDRRRAGSGSEGSDLVLAPMTGSVRKVWVVAEESVSKGQPLVVLEAMKMEHVLLAPREGVIAEVNAKEGTQAEAHSVLVRLHPPTS
jgi:acetyl/propionyl-CoA carboxylase alpha subunit